MKGYAHTAISGKASLDAEGLYRGASGEGIHRNCRGGPRRNDSFHAETNSCGICRDRRARISLAHFGGTAVSAPQTEFAPGERDA
jgi:hypothetical protein